MVSKEACAYLETSEEQMKDAELALREGRYALCSFLSASSSENATSALIITLGAKPSRKHRNSLVIYRLLGSVPPDMRQHMLEIIEQLKVLEPHITKTRYPIMRDLDLLPPSRFYTDEIARKAVEQARVIMKTAKLIVKSREAK